MARDHNYVRPKLVEENAIHIVQGRHPITEQYLDSFVPNSIDLIAGLGVRAEPAVAASNYRSEENVGVISRSSIPDEDDKKEFKSMVIVTGSNSGGKSTYIKQNALIVYALTRPNTLSYIQLTLPGIWLNVAALFLLNPPHWDFATRVCYHHSNRMSPVGNDLREKLVLGSIQTVESSSSLQSSFLVDMAQVSFALRQATRHSLVILDEVATATNKLGWLLNSADAVLIFND